MRPCHSLLGPLAAAIAVLAAPSTARAHCDTMDGPVLEEARAALASGDVVPVLKWIAPEHEALVSVLATSSHRRRAEGSAG